MGEKLCQTLAFVCGLSRDFAKLFFWTHCRKKFNAPILWFFLLFRLKIPNYVPIRWSVHNHNHFSRNLSVYERNFCKTTWKNTWTKLYNTFSPIYWPPKIKLLGIPSNMVPKSRKPGSLYFFFSFLSVWKDPSDDYIALPALHLSIARNTHTPFFLSRTRSRL